jgi:ABC-type nitrate/sulfonate/bicarbonate transport system substrate-binding protein
VKKTRCALVAMLAMVLGTGVGEAQPLEDVTIGLGSRSLAGGSVRIADEIGLFEKHGLNPTFVFTDSPTVSITGLLSGSYKFAVTGFPDFLAARAQGQDVVVVAPTYEGLGINIVLDKDVAAGLGVARDAPVEERLKAMDGLLIAATGPSSTTRISLDAAAKAAGSNVRFTFMTYQAMISALETGAIQGFVAAAPFWAQPVIGGTAVDWISVKDEFQPEFVPTMSSALGTTADVIADDPELVERIAAVIADIGVAVDERPAEVEAAMAKLYEGLDAQTIEVLFRTEAPSWRTEPLTEEQVVREIDYLKAYELAPRGIDSVEPKSIIYGQ